VASTGRYAVRGGHVIETSPRDQPKVKVGAGGRRRQDPVEGRFMPRRAIYREPVAMKSAFDGPLRAKTERQTLSSRFWLG